MPSARNYKKLGLLPAAVGKRAVEWLLRWEREIRNGESWMEFRWAAEEQWYRDMLVQYAEDCRANLQKVA